MNFAFHPAAEEEFAAAVDWYEARQPGLGVVKSLPIAVSHPLG